jgi:hypothetical protein
MNAALLRELASVPHDARMRRMAELGRAAAGDAQVAATLAALAGGGFHERLLALQSCCGSRDGAHALRALSDPSRTLQNRALPLLALSGTDAQARDALQAARPGQHKHLLRLLRRRGRLGPVDAFLEDLAARNPAALAVLLPFGSGPVVERHLAEARHLGGQVFWRRLAVFHPDRAAALLRQELEGPEPPDARRAYEAEAALAALADSRPDAALLLARALAAHRPLVRSAAALQTLARRCPDAVADLLLASPDTVPVRLDASAHRLDPARLRALLESRPGAVAAPQVWFPRLRPRERAEAFANASAAWRDAEGCLPLPLLRWLPAPLRTAEARRHLDLPALSTRPAQRLPYAALLPWDEARAVLGPWLGHPEGELRGLALYTLAGTVRFERARLADLLDLFHARRREQDPVRGRMLAGLAELPPGAWGAGRLAALGEVLRDTLSAADLSPATASSAERLVVALLPRHPDWAAGWLATLVEERGHIHLGDLQNRLSEDDVRRLAPSLLPVLRSWRNRERQGQLATLAQSLGRRLPAFEGLAEVLEGEVRATRTQWAAEHTLGVLARHCRPRLAALVPRLVQDDPSWVTRPVVYHYLHRRRQDLLTPFLGQQAYSGRFSTGRTRFLLPLSGGFFRWAPAQQTAFFGVLHEAARAGSDVRDTPTVLAIIRQLAALPAGDVGPLAELARDVRPAVQEGALRALGRLGAGQGVPELMEALGDDRARVAVYALRAAVLAMPPAHALELLRTVRPARVTVAKEYVRLLGELPVEGAFTELQRLDGEALHRDVRIALLRALWGHLERPGAWEILERAARAADAATMDGVVRIPADRLSGPSQGRLLALLAGALAHPEPSVRLQVLGRCAALPVPDPEQVLLPRLLAALASRAPDERRSAAAAVCATCKPPDAPLIARAVAGVLPDRRALVTAVAALQGAVGADRRRLAPVARAVLAALSPDPLTAGLRAGLAAAGLPWDEWAGLLRGMAATGELHADTLAAAAAGVSAWADRPDRGDLEKLEASLAAERDERLRRLALAALLAQARLPGGWNGERLQRLRAFRQDPAPLVAAAAAFTLPAEE